MGPTAPEARGASSQTVKRGIRSALLSSRPRFAGEFVLHSRDSTLFSVTPNGIERENKTHEVCVISKPSLHPNLVTGVQEVAQVTWPFCDGAAGIK